MIVREATDADISFVCAFMRDHNARELFAVRFHSDRAQIAFEICARHRFCIRLEALCLDDGRPAALLGAWLAGPRLAAVQMLMTDDWPAIARSAVKHIRKRFIPAVLMPNVTRAELTVLQTAEFSLDWLAWLGFCAEGVMRQRGMPPENFVNLAWLHPDPASLSTVDAAAAGVASPAST
jgi:hypothetical protein